MTEETTTEIPEIDNKETSDKDVVSATTKDLNVTKNAIIKAYFDKWDEEKWLWIPVVNKSLNVMRGTQKKKLLNSLEVTKPTTSIEWISPDQIQQNITENINTQIDKNIIATPMGKFRYEQEKMNNLKTLLSKSDTELSALKTQIDEGSISLDEALMGTTIAAATAETAAVVSKETSTAEKTSESTEVKRGDYIYPVPGVKINSPAGSRYLKELWRHTHKGVDIAAATNTPILSIGDWEVEDVWFGIKWFFGGYGNFMVVKLKNWDRVLYGHMNKLAQNADGTQWKKWDMIKSSDQVWLMGNTWTSTGAHLHLEIREWTPDDAVNYFSRKYKDPIAVLPVTKDMVNSNILARVDSKAFMDATETYKAAA